MKGVTTMKYLLVSRTSTMSMKLENGTTGVQCPLEHDEGSILSCSKSPYQVTDLYDLRQIPNSRLSRYDIYVIDVLGELKVINGHLTTDEVEIVHKLTEQDRNEMFAANDERFRARRKSHIKYTLEVLTYWTGCAMVGYTIGKIIKKITSR